MMDDFIPFATPKYGLLFLLLLGARGMDFLSTWVATPNLVLEGNPIAKKLGWKWGMLVNLLLCFGLAFWKLPAILISTTSMLVAARNFQSAWLMRTLGEEVYRYWHVQRVQETPVTLFLFCLFAQSALVAGVGGAVIYFGTRQSGPEGVLPSIGWGILCYALALTFFTLLAIWRLRRSDLHRAQMAKRKLLPESALAPSPRSSELVNVWLGEDARS